MSDADRMRLDKWLWAARFYKTRKLAAEAVSGGKVHLNGQRSKPGKEVSPGSRLHITKNGLEWDIEVLVLPKQRRPASEAAGFWSESQRSLEHREKQLALLRAARAAAPVHTEGRPSKKDRRLIHRFKQQ
ncbi:RNA-binding S4 domain-containing protein [Thiolapillus brandeum]|uniref:Heat shock protein 15 n=1 Tax=Thiolapillus brandeum TaxID=1076588 RepID=A0A7U6JKE8_9GAMM|nr:S4 domain-containing protein [Thiolapillus brandeum]BAO45355.1 ribosome-associated heat shock protein HSP15 [Thiolapillus brandeum]